MAEHVRDLVPVLQLELCHFLERLLPAAAGDGWWTEAVIGVLSIPQVRTVESEGVTELAGLDLAALLRVTDKNWYRLSSSANLPRRGRNYLNELMDVRNRLAHATSQPVDAGLELRDADTVARFLEVLSASEEARRAADQLKEKLLARLGNVAAVPDGPAPSEPPGGPPPEASVSNGGEGTDTGDVGEEESDGDSADEDVLGDEPRGLSLGVLGPEAGEHPQVAAALGEATYVGIDFGTSTTVVSVVSRDPNGKGLLVRPLPVRQETRDRGSVVHHLVPTCVAWTDSRLIVGEGASEYKLVGVEGRDVWSSFKMRLGVNLGPEYRNTLLSRVDSGTPTIERPQDAAREFFTFLRNSIEEYVQAEGLPPRIYYAVSVPASFEANQRRDLIQALEAAGLETSESALIDEPNAAFLSYFYEMLQTSERFVSAFESAARKVLVFDFGAGTCDISLLRIAIENGRITSTNLAISRFLALGGNDIDDAIARDILVPQLTSATGKIDRIPTNLLDSVVLPRLRAEAERLKISCAKQLETRGLKTVAALRGVSGEVMGRAVPPLQVGQDQWTLNQPRMTFSQFGDVMKRFLEDPSDDPGTEAEDAKSVLAPIADAMKKAKVGRDELDLVLFIGGSAENVLVQEAVGRFVGRFAEKVVPRDLRAHVATGAGIHSLLFHGLNSEVIQPITSEPILVATRGGEFEVLLPAGTPVPSPDLRVTELHVMGDDQRIIELPICVSTRDKVLHVISIENPADLPFARDTPVRISCSLNRQKLLRVKVRVGGTKASVQILNPLANREVSAMERSYLEAQQRFNEAVILGKGRPSLQAILGYVEAAEEVGRHRECAEMLEAAGRIAPERDFSTSISYHYANAGEEERSAEWSEVAYKRRRSAVTAYNLALSRLRQGRETEYVALMKECLNMDPAFTAALFGYGNYLSRRDKEQGRKLREKAYNLLRAELAAGYLDASDEGRLERLAKEFGDRKVIEEISEIRQERRRGGSLYDEEKLIGRRVTDRAERGD